MDNKQKRSSKWRLILKGFIAFLLAWAIWSVWPALTYHEIQPIKEYEPGHRYLKGGYHMHTRFSDGMGTVADLARAAKKAHLDWLILTDHGGPNLGSENAGGWVDGVLLIGASELSSDAGHLVVIGSDSSYKLPLEPQLAIDELEHRKGMTFIAHPYDDKIPWTDWTVERYSGIEIFSLYESVKSASWHRLLQFPLQYMVNEKYAILRALTYPEMPLRKWKQLNRERKNIILGIYALDAHGRIPISKKIALPFPSYESMFSTLSIYTPVPAEAFSAMSAGEATAYILSSIKKGNYFNAVESMASAEGVFLEFRPADGSETSPWIFGLNHPYENVQYKLYRNGDLHEEGAAPGELRRELPSPGRYHVELYLPDHPFAELPWVIGTPADIPPAEAASGTPGEGERAVPSFFSTLPPNGYALEKNESSYGEILVDDSRDPLAPCTIMRYSVRIPTQGQDSWCSCAVRDPEALEKYVRNGTGIYAELSASRRSTVWLEVRTADRETGKESWFRHSIVLGRDKDSVVIPYSRMTRIFGSAEAVVPQSISALFLSVNGSTDFIPSQGEIYIHQLGAYREKE